MLKLATTALMINVSMFAKGKNIIEPVMANVLSVNCLSVTQKPNEHHLHRLLLLNTVLWRKSSLSRFRYFASPVRKMIVSLNASSVHGSPSSLDHQFLNNDRNNAIALWLRLSDKLVENVLLNVTVSLAAWATTQSSGPLAVISLIGRPSSQSTFQLSLYIHHTYLIRSHNNGSSLKVAVEWNMRLL